MEHLKLLRIRRWKGHEKHEVILDNSAVKGGSVPVASFQYIPNNIQLPRERIWETEYLSEATPGRLRSSNSTQDMGMRILEENMIHALSGRSDQSSLTIVQWCAALTLRLNVILRRTVSATRPVQQWRIVSLPRRRSSPSCPTSHIPPRLVKGYSMLFVELNGGTNARYSINRKTQGPGG